MEKEQLEKKVEWLDVERRKALETLAALESRLAKLEGSQPKRESSSKTLAAYKTRLDAYDKQLSGLENKQAAQKKEVQGISKQAQQLEKTFQQENKGLGKLLEDFRKEVAQLQALQKSVNGHREQLLQVEGRLEALSGSIQDVITGEQKRAQLAQSLEDASKEDAKRLTELHAEVAALLTQLGSAGKQSERVQASQRNLEKRMDEVQGAEVERRLEHDKALEKLSVAQFEHEKTWKDWSKRFETIEQLSTQIGEKLNTLETTELAVKRAQRSFEDLVEKISRRINELNEIQRLGDQRFRQEWSTFQTDAQKRWSNFALTQEEQQRERSRQYEKLSEQATRIEDNLRELQDSFQHLNDQSERNLQTLLEMARDSLAENERFISNSR